MGMFLNNIVPAERYKTIVRTRFFVDKTLMIAEMISSSSVDGQRYFCITRPRRFGKSVMADMIAAFFGRTAKSGSVFQNLNILRAENYQSNISKDHILEYFNKYDMIYIDFSEVPEKCSSYDEYITRILEGLRADLREAFPEFISNRKSVWDIMTDIFQKTKQKFVFVMDEWDAIFHMPFISDKDKQEFLRFLKALLKDKAYVEIAYMTGVLPIAKYSSGSEINMFKEYDMATSEVYSEYFGFCGSEVDVLFEIYLRTTQRPKITRNDLQDWYDGYHTAGEIGRAHV